MEQATMHSATVPSPKQALLERSAARPEPHRPAESTPEFERWFGGSVVVDGQGRPLVLYRGDREPVHEFTREGRREPGLFLAVERERAAYYGEPIEVYARIERLLDLTDPHWAFRSDPMARQIIQDLHDDHIADLHHPDSGELYTIGDTLDGLESGDLWRMDGLGGWKMGAWRAMQRYAEANGYDGIKVHDSGEGWGIGVDYIVFDPNQVKSAAHNSGEFSRERDDIRHSVAADAPARGRVPAAEAGPQQRATQALQAWFGNSKIVDDSGRPLVVYHGTCRSFAVFSQKMLGWKTSALDAKLGFFFAENPDAADMFTWEAGEQHGGNILPVYLRMENPFICTDLLLDGSTGTQAGRVMTRARAAGHDGVIFERSDMLGHTGRSFAVFEPTQVKSAIGNRGTFDRHDPDLRHSIPPAGDWLFHVTPAANLASISAQGLQPAIGPRAALLGEPRPASYYFKSLQAVDDAMLGWLGDAFPDDEPLALLAVPVALAPAAPDGAAGFEVVSTQPVPPHALQLLSLDLWDAWRLAELPWRRLCEAVGAASQDQGLGQIRLSQNPPAVVPAAWTQALRSAAFERWFQGSKVVEPGTGAPRRVFHGTTHSFDAFEPRRANPDCDWGSGLYFSSSPLDASTNYAAEDGADLTARIDRLAEALGDELDDQQAWAEASRRLSGGQPNVMPVYLALRTPLIVGSPDETRFVNDLCDPEDEARGPVSLHRMLAALREVLQDERWDGADLERVLVDVEELADGRSRLPASQLVDALARSRGMECVADLEANGELCGGEIIRRALQAAGFDGVIDHTVNAKFGTDSKRRSPHAGISRETVHYVAFRPEQVKSATGNRGTFDLRNPDLRASEAARYPGRLVRQPRITQTLGDGTPQRPYDFASDPAFRHLFYGEPNAQDVAEFGRWLRSRPNAFVRLYHGTAAVNPVFERGLLPASRTRRNSYQSASGFVCASVYPGSARDFGVMAALNRGIAQDGARVAVYPVVTTIRRLRADLDQLANRRASGREVGNSLVDSLVYGHGARYRGRVEPWCIGAPMLLRDLREDLPLVEPPAVQAQERERAGC